MYYDNYANVKLLIVFSSEIQIPIVIQDARFFGPETKPPYCE